MGRTLCLAIVVLALAGCNTYGQPTPVEEARVRPPLPLVAEAMRPEGQAPAGLPGGPIQLQGRQWVAMATTWQLPERAVRIVARGEDGRVLGTLAWDEPPFDRLLAQRGPGLWQEYLEVR
jgi:hypothetical protein